MLQENLWGISVCSAQSQLPLRSHIVQLRMHLWHPHVNCISLCVHHTEIFMLHQVSSFTLQHVCFFLHRMQMKIAQVHFPLRWEDDQWCWAVMTRQTKDIQETPLLIICQRRSAKLKRALMTVYLCPSSFPSTETLQYRCGGSPEHKTVQHFCT